MRIKTVEQLNTIRTKIGEENYKASLRLLKDKGKLFFYPSKEEIKAALELSQ